MIGEIRLVAQEPLGEPRVQQAPRWKMRLISITAIFAGAVTAARYSKLLLPHLLGSLGPPFPVLQHCKVVSGDSRDVPLAAGYRG